jgi:CYTH domain-containing protein
VSGDGREIERKYLLARAPDPAALARLGARSSRIEQVYLRPEPGRPVRRVRRRADIDGETFTYTEKSPVHGIVREERESTIDAARYAELAAEQDPGSHPIRKVRHVLPWAGREVEIDIFELPPGLVVAEVELTNEDDAVELPSELEVVRDVSEEPEYQNVNLARR